MENNIIAVDDFMDIKIIHVIIFNFQSFFNLIVSIYQRERERERERERQTDRQTDSEREREREIHVNSSSLSTQMLLGSGDVTE